MTAVSALTGLAIEVGWVSAHLAIYPFGLLRDRGDDPDPARFRFGDLPLAQRGLIGADVEAATTPIGSIAIIRTAPQQIVQHRTLLRQSTPAGASVVGGFDAGPSIDDV